MTYDYELYQRLRFATLLPGETIGGQRKPYEPVNYSKWDMSYDELIASPDTPRIAYLRARYEYGSMATVGMRGVA